MGWRRWTLDQYFPVALAGGSRRCPGCRFGNNPPPDALASPRLRGFGLLPVVGLRRCHRGQTNRPSATGVPRFRSMGCRERVQAQSIHVDTVLDRVGVPDCYRCRLLLVLPKGAARYVVFRDTDYDVRCI